MLNLSLRDYSQTVEELVAGVPFELIIYKLER